MAEWLRISNRIGWPLTIGFMRIVRRQYPDDYDLREHFVAAFDTAIKSLGDGNHA